jgi:hypothetical protein
MCMADWTTLFNIAVPNSSESQKKTGNNLLDAWVSSIESHRLMNVVRNICSVSGYIRYLFRVRTIHILLDQVLLENAS